MDSTNKVVLRTESITDKATSAVISEALTLLLPWITSNHKNRPENRLQKKKKKWDVEGCLFAKRTSAGVMLCTGDL